MKYVEQNTWNTHGTYMEIYMEQKLTISKKNSFPRNNSLFNSYT